MASLPLLLSLADEFNGLAMSPAAPLNPWYVEPSYSHYYRHPVASSMKQLLDMKKELSKELCSQPPIGKDGFQVSMDVTHFKPNELHVKVVDDCILVEAKHEERQDDHGYISRHFVRRYKLPEGYDSQKVISTLSSDGVLTVKAPKPAIEDKTNERIIQIQQTGPAHLNVKDNAKEQEKVEN